MVGGGIIINMLIYLKKKFAKKLNVKYALATSSCTGAIHIAIAALDLPKGSEVIMADSIGLLRSLPSF